MSDAVVSSSPAVPVHRPNRVRAVVLEVVKQWCSRSRS